MLAKNFNSKVSLGEKNEAARDLILALFCVGATSNEIKEAIVDYIENSINMFWKTRRIRNNYLNQYMKSDSSFILQVLKFQEITWLSMHLKEINYLHSKLAYCIEFMLGCWKCQDNPNNPEYEDRIHLEICLGALTNSLYSMNKTNFCFSNNSMIEAIIERNGVKFGLIIDQELKNIFTRINQSNFDMEVNFLGRTKIFRDFGFGYFLTGLRKIAEVNGCVIPQPAEETQLFYLD